MQIKIPYKAVYFLLESYYIRKTLDGYINDYIISPDVFQSSLIMAGTIEDYIYLNVMINKRTQLTEEYVIFVKDGELPLSIQAFKDLSLLQLAILCHKTVIDIPHFISLIESVCHNENIDSSSQVDYFKLCISKLESIN